MSSSAWRASTAGTSTMATAGFCADAAGGVKLPGWLAAALLLAASAAAAEEIDGVAAAQKATGFDFYVLSLSWSPSFCTLQGSQAGGGQCGPRSEEHTSELQSRENLVCRLL